MKLRFWHTGLVLLMASLLAGACKKGNDVAATQYNAYLDVINATDSVFNVYQNGSRLNSTANINIASSSGYLNAPITIPSSGTVYSFKRPVNVYASPVPAPTTLFSKTLTLDSGKHYMLFVTGNTAASAFLFKDADSSLVDTLRYPKVRFVHAAPSLGTVSVKLNNKVKFTGATFGSVSKFTTDTAVATVVSVYAAGNTLPVATFTQTLEDGVIYTIFIKDTKSSTGTTYTAGFFLNN